MEIAACIMISPLLLGTSESYKKSWCIIEITCSWLTTIGEPLFTLIEARMGFQYHTNWMEECCWRIDKVDNLVDLKCCMTGLTNSLTIYVHSIETRSHSETRYSTAKTTRQSRPIHLTLPIVSRHLLTHLFSLYIFPSLPFAAEARTPIFDHIGLGELLPLTLSESTLCFNWCDCM